MNTKLLNKTTAQQVADFRDNGCLCIRQAFDQDWISLLRTGMEKSMQVPGEFVWTYTDESDGRHFHNENRRWHQIEEYRRFIFESPVGQLIGQLAGWHEACLLFDSAFMRTSGTTTKTPWHQDLPYLCVEGEHALVSAWIPLYPIARESSLMCVRGSHRWNKNFFRQNFDPAGDKAHMQTDNESAWDTLPDIDNDPKAFDIEAHAMTPGDCLIIDGSLLHGSAGNQDLQNPQAVITIRLLGEKAIYQPDKPGGVQPDLSKYAMAAGLKPGDPVKSDLFPLVWSHKAD